nr:zinc finger protein 433-like [Aedes albopictus]
MANVRKRPPASTSEAKGQQPPQAEKSADSVCRVCMGRASDSGLMIGLFDGQIQGTILAEVLTLVGAVELATEDDRLPKWCCEECLKALESAYILRTLCQDSDRKLRDALLMDAATVVVKEEVDEDKSKLEDRDELLNAEETGFSEHLQLPKLEIMDCVEEDEIQQMSDGVGGAHGMAEDNGGTVSDEVDEDQDEKMSREVNKPNHGKKPLNPDAFDEVEAVGFKCCGCKVIFNTSKELKSHSKEAHAHKKLTKMELQRKKQCDICYKVLSHDLSVWNHQKKDKLNFRCKVCGDLFWSRQRVCLHYDRVHGPNPMIKGPSKVCCGCQEHFETEEQLREHSVTVHLPNKPPPDPTRPYTCNVCYRCYKSDSLLYAHQSRRLKDAKKHVCDQCGVAFRYPGALKYHIMSHTGEKQFQCTKCPRIYSNWNSFRQHVSGHNMPADKYKCKICGDIFKTRNGLKQHTLQHTGERPYKCPHCPATFALLAGLNCHSFTHTDEKTQECPICGKQFKRQTELKQHLNHTHHKQKPFACFFCPKRYPRKDRRKQHMLQVHPKELQSNPLPSIELLGNPWSLRQRTEEAVLRQQGMIE